MAIAISTLSLVSLAVGIGIFVFYDFIASYEERRLLEMFGPEYRDYQGRVPKWVPRLKPRRG